MVHILDGRSVGHVWSYQAFLKRNQYNDPDPIKLWPDPAILGFITPLFHLNKRVSDPDPFIIEGGLLSGSGQTVAGSTTLGFITHFFH